MRTRELEIILDEMGNITRNKPKTWVLVFEGLECNPLEKRGKYLFYFYYFPCKLNHLIQGIILNLSKKWNVVLGLLFITFDVSHNLWSISVITWNWLEPKTKPSKPNWDWQNPWYTRYHSLFKVIHLIFQHLIWLSFLFGFNESFERLISPANLHSFYVRWSQKRKKIVKSSVSFSPFWISEQKKSCSKNVGQIDPLTVDKGCIVF